MTLTILLILTKIIYYNSNVYKYIIIYYIFLVTMDEWMIDISSILRNFFYMR